MPGNAQSEQRPTTLRTRSSGFWSRITKKERPVAVAVAVATAPPSPPQTSHDEAQAAAQARDRAEAAAQGPSLLREIEAVGHSLLNVGPSGIRTLIKAKEAAAFNVLVDDRSYLMENVIKTAVQDAHGTVGIGATQNFVTQLWNDLPHPPATYLAGTARFRTADGSGNSILHPQLGASGQPYARTVNPTSTQPVVQPDPNVLFDCLLQRRKPTEHPAQISSILFYLATVIIHDLFRTDHKNFSYSKTSSYLDLAPLYGSDLKEQMSMRTQKDGKLFPDCFAETRLLVLPPGAGILLIMFNRFHNHVADQLVAINEGGRFTKPDPSNEQACQKFDEEVFQTARLITCGLYINIVLLDYVRTILNLNRTDSDWHLDPRIDIPGGPEMGTGNQVSAEFNLVYRWHATVSPKDEKWTEDEFAKLFPGQKPADIPMPQFLRTLGMLEAKLESQTPFERPFGEFKRDAEGFYNDEQLVESICSRIDDCANAYGPRQCPAILKAVEVLGIKQARSWNLATLNEFRKHFALAPHTSFESITEDVEVATHLKNLYKHPDNVELYPGMLVEDAKYPQVPGSGLCPSYTVSRAVLSDAVVLVRGDRFYTTSYSPRLLTNWGYEEANYDTKVDLGCVMYKLFQRAFPRYFNPDSIYIHYPLTVAKANKTDVFVHHLPQRANLYDKELYQANAPDFKGRAAPSVVSSAAEYQAVKDNLAQYSVDVSLVSAMLYPRSRENASFSSAIGKFLGQSQLSSSSVSAEVLASLRSDLESDIRKALDKESYPLVNYKEVDIVSEVINKCATRAAMALFDVHTHETTEAEVQEIFTVVAAALSNFDRVYLTAMRQRAVPIANKLRESMLDHAPKTAYARSIHTAAHAAGLSKEQTFVATVTLAASFATTLAQSLAESVAYILAPANAAVLSALPTSADAFIADIARVSSQAVLKLTSGDATLLLSGALLGQDATAYPDPNAVSARASTLPLSLLFPADQAWQSIHLAALTAGLRAIVSQKGLRAASVSTGLDTLRRVPVNVGVAGAQVAYLSTKWDTLQPGPRSMVVNWDL